VDGAELDDSGVPVDVLVDPEVLGVSVVTGGVSEIVGDVSSDTLVEDPLVLLPGGKDVDGTDVDGTDVDGTDVDGTDVDGVSVV